MSGDGVDRRSAAERVFDALRQQIIDGTLAPQSHLIQERIAAEMSISRTPVREALNRLAHNGFVTSVPGRGFVVTQVRMQDIEDVKGVRRVLESAALEAALPLFTSSDLHYLKAVYQEMVDADPDTTDYVDLTRRFHLALVGPCANRLLIKYIEELWVHPSNLKVIGRYADSEESIKVMIDDHWELIDAIESSDPSRALPLLTEHIETVHRVLTVGVHPTD